MCYWLAIQVRRYCGCQAIRQWEAAVTWFGQCMGADSNTSWRQHYDYVSLRKTLIFRYQLPPTEKMPFTLKHIIEYTKARGVLPGKYWTVPYDDLLEIVWLQLSFLTMSRPCELLRKPSDDHKFGLKFADFQYHNPYDWHFYKLKVWHYKNQRSRRLPKDLLISDTRCGDTTCHCTIVNPYILLYVLLKRRKILAKMPHQTALQRRMLPDHPKNPIFVRRSGHELTTRNTGSIISHLAQVSRVLEPEKYTEYSLRVGGATHCTAAAIPDGLMYRYVGWDTRALPDSGSVYKNPTLELKLRFPYFMLHGFVDYFGRQYPLHPQPAIFHDPWAHGDIDVAPMYR